MHEVRAAPDAAARWRCHRELLVDRRRHRRPRACGVPPSKQGVIGLTKAAALDYATEGIRINAVCPGSIDTPLAQDLAPDADAMVELLRGQPIGRLGRSEEIAAAVL